MKTVYFYILNMQSRFMVDVTNIKQFERSVLGLEPLVISAKDEYGLLWNINCHHISMYQIVE